MIDIVALAALIAMVVLAYRTKNLRLRIIVLTALLVVYLGRELTAMYIVNYSIPNGTVDKLFFLQLSSGAKDVLWPNIAYASYEMLVMVAFFVMCLGEILKEHRAKMKRSRT